jgi:DNA-binding NarL/FixJ family response regulator
VLLLLRAQPGFLVVGEAASTTEAIERCRATRPDVLVLTTRLPSLSGVPAVAAVHAALPQLKMLAVAERGEARCLVLNPPRSGQSWHPDEPPARGAGTDCLLLAVAHGALGAIRRSAEPEDFFRAVRAVAAGQAWYELGTASRLLERALSLSRSDGQRALSPREVEVAHLIAEGRSNKEIAGALGICEATVKRHIGHILDKLELKDRLQLGLFVVRNPLVLDLHAVLAR